MSADPLRCGDIASILHQAALVHGEAIALIAPGGHSLSFRQLQARVAVAAANLRHEADGAVNARRFGIVLPNGLDMSVALLAACCAGIAVPFNPAYAEDEYHAYFGHARIDRLIVDPEACGPAVRAAARTGLALIPVGRALAATDKKDASAGAAGVLRPDDIAMVLMTSGTTGKGKLVPLSHRHLCVGASYVIGSVALGPGDRVLSMWEQFHIGGIVDLLLAPLMSGGSVVVAGGFDAARFFEMLPKHRPTWFQGVPTTLHELCHRAAASRLDCRGSSLRFVRSVAAALPPAWMAEIEALFGVPVIQTFGMTEAAPLITSTRLPPAVRKPGSTGSSCGTMVAIVDAEGKPLPAGTSGHVAIRGDNVFGGYENDPQANAEAFRAGWFHTGDLGYLDGDRDLFLVGRAKELVNRGGEKISPYEVEEFLLRHPGVEEAAVFAVPHPTLGEDLGAAIVRRDGTSASPADLGLFVSRHLAAFKVPRHFLFIDALPKNVIGKVARKDLAALHAESLRAGAGPEAPTNELEAALAGLWAEELDIPAVGIDDNFAAIGGDSLSSVRIFLAAEALIGFKLPEPAAAHFDTVRNMAACLVELGCSTTPPFGHTSAVASREAILEELSQAMLGRAAMAPDLLYSATGERAFETARHMAENISTPAELRRLLNQDDKSAGIGRLFARPLVSFNIWRRRAAMRRAFDRATTGARAPMRWMRQEVSRNADLFTSGDGLATAKTLLVGFSSRAMRLTTPTYNILCALDPDGFDLLLLRDPSRRHYLFGIPELGDTIEAAARWLADYSGGYRRAVALGTSSGGIPAICAAILNGWPNVLAAGADRPSQHPHLHRLLDHCASVQARDNATDIVVAFSAGKERDALGAAEIGQKLPTARLRGDRRFREHALLHLLQEKGELAAFLRDNLTG